MRILYVTAFQNSWSTETHAAHGLRELGHTVVLVPEKGLRWSVLVARARHDRADLVLWTHFHPGNHDEQEAALESLRQAGIPVVSYHLDRYWGLSAREHMVYEDPFFRTDLVVTADGGHADRWAELGIRHAWLPPGVHGPEVKRGTFRPEYEADVCFVGGAETYPHPEWRDERLRLVGFLRERYGERFRLWPEDPRKPLRGMELNDVFASTKVVVGDSCLAGGATHYWSDRVPETLGRGGFLLHPYVDGIEDWYAASEHLGLFDLGDHTGLGMQVDYWLTKDGARRQITDNAMRLVAERDTYTRRMDELLALAAADPVRRGWVDGRTGVVTLRQAGVSARFDLRPNTSDSVAVREVWQQGAYRLERAHVEGGLVVDVGAHVGAFSILALSLGAKHVLAVEPNPENREGLSANLDLNRPFAGAVSIMPSALCDDCDEALMTFDGSGSHLSTDVEDGQPVIMTTLLEGVSGWLLRTGEVNADIAFLKMDCEGCEYASLDSLAKVLPRVRRAAFEFHGPRMPHLSHLDTSQFGALCVVLAEHGVFEVVGRASTGGMVYWEAHR